MINIAPSIPIIEPRYPPQNPAQSLFPDGNNGITDRAYIAIGIRINVITKAHLFFDSSFLKSSIHYFPHKNFY